MRNTYATEGKRNIFYNIDLNLLPHRLNKKKGYLSIRYYHVPYEFQSESTLYSLPDCQGTPCSKQASYLKFKWQQRDEVSTFLLCVFSELSLATTSTVVKPVSCYYITSFNYGGKKARDVGYACRRYMSNIMPNSIFYDSMGRRITQFFSLAVVISLHHHIKDGFSLITITPMGVGKP